MSYEFENLTNQDIERLVNERPEALLSDLQNRHREGTRYAASVELVALSLYGEKDGTFDSYAKCLMAASAIQEPVFSVTDVARGFRRLAMGSLVKV